MKLTGALVIALISTLSSKEALAYEKHGLMSAQCKEKGGRVEGDFAVGCKDSEVSIGRVIDMKCPCSCCVLAPVPGKSVSNRPPSTALRSIPQADRQLFKSIRDFWDWKNPFLLVGGKEVKILHRSSVPTEQLISKLAKLPPEAWPYGRVVAVQINPNSSRDGKEKIKQNLAEVIKRLKELGFEVEMWPSA